MQGRLTVPLGSCGAVGGPLIVFLPKQQEEKEEKFNTSAGSRVE